MALQSNTNLIITELTNEPLANPICTISDSAWTVSYNEGQDFKISVEIPDAVPGTTYGLNQTQYLSIRTGIYSTANDNIDEDSSKKEKSTERVQLWQTPPQNNTTFDFKGHWLDSDNSIHPYYSSEATATIPENASNPHKITLHMHKTPNVTLPRQLQHKSNTSQKLDIKQLDIQDGYLISLFKSPETKPLAQWYWEYKVAFVPSSEDGSPQFVPHPYFAQKCTEGSRGYPNLRGPSLSSGGQTDHFRTVDGERVGMGEVREWTTEVLEDWEASD